MKLMGKPNKSQCVYSVSSLLSIQTDANHTSRIDCRDCTFGLENDADTYVGRSWSRSSTLTKTNFANAEE
ncbi:hypothetical protein MTR_5g069650 [Medicago truncatula]|uniref:Uncharacterized protein n=1 Tax=Medicago truncatula TaxID=3880 RepID=G7KE39_MEDTR|nr:hypothetical protein MTR_5g069650 [Medicago truncatula]